MSTEGRGLMALKLRKVSALYLPDWAWVVVILPVMLVAPGWVTYPREGMW